MQHRLAKNSPCVPSWPRTPEFPSLCIECRDYRCPSPCPTCIVNLIKRVLSLRQIYDFANWFYLGMENGLTRCMWQNWW